MEEEEEEVEELVPLVEVAGLVNAVLGRGKRVEQPARESLLAARRACSRAHNSSSKSQVSPGQWRFSMITFSSGFKQEITCSVV